MTTALPKRHQLEPNQFYWLERTIYGSRVAIYDVREWRLDAWPIGSFW